MSNRVWFNVYITVRDGKLEEFKAMAKDWIETHREHTPEILAYEWFTTSDDEMKVQVMELYESSEAMIAYMSRGGGSKFKPPYPYTVDKLEILGKVSDALRKRLDSGESNPEYFDHFDGFTR